MCLCFYHSLDYQIEMLRNYETPLVALSELLPAPIPCTEGELGIWSASTCPRKQIS